MDTLQLKKVEDILNLGNNINSVSIRKKDVMKFIYENQVITIEIKPFNDYGINVHEVKSLYSKFLMQWYKCKEYNDDIIFSKTDIERIILKIK